MVVARLGVEDAQVRQHGLEQFHHLLAVLLVDPDINFASPFIQGRGERLGVIRTEDGTFLLVVHKFFRLRVSRSVQAPIH